jgi:hypothetical protein
MWAGVSTAAGGAASAAATTAAAATGAGGSSGGAAGTGGALAGSGASALKMIALGTLLGGTLTVGTAAVLLHVGPTRTAPQILGVKASVAGAATLVATEEGRKIQGSGGGLGVEATLSGVDATPQVQQADGVSGSSTAGASEIAPAAAPGAAPSGRNIHSGRARPPRRIEDSSSLSLEASLITEARSALAEGDAISALRKARAARALPVRQLVPEELAVEAQALRALGREAEANAVDQALRAQYPESALAR